MAGMPTFSFSPYSAASRFQTFKNAFGGLFIGVFHFALLETAFQAVSATPMLKAGECANENKANIGSREARGWVAEGSESTPATIMAAHFSLLSLQQLAAVVVVCETLNTLSHLGVVWGALRHRVFVLSILIGVSFDVISWCLYVSLGALWLSPSFAGCSPIPLAPLPPSLPPSLFLSLPPLPSLALFLLLLVPSSLFHLLTHLHALLLFLPSSSSASLPRFLALPPPRSFSRVASLVKSAANNLQGEPGEGWKDHLLAYTDTSDHAFFLSLAVRLMQSERGRGGGREGEGREGGGGGVRLMGVVAVMTMAVFVLVVRGEGGGEKARKDGGGAEGWEGKRKRRGREGGRSAELAELISVEGGKEGERENGGGSAEEGGGGSSRDTITCQCTVCSGEGAFRIRLWGGREGGREGVRRGARGVRGVCRLWVSSFAELDGAFRIVSARARGKEE